MQNNASSLLETLKESPFFQIPASSMQRQDCPFDYLEKPDREQMLKGYIQEEITCLELFWRRSLSSMHITLSPERPDVQFTDISPYSTECQKNITAPTAECRPQGLIFHIGDENYYSGNSPDTLWTFFEIISAYSFWLLDAAGINELAYKSIEELGSNTPRAREVYHRLNLSVSCINGIYLGVQYGTDPDNQNFFQEAYNNTNNVIADVNKPPAIDDPSPFGFNTLAWFKKGADTKKVSNCNTWTAPASEVQ